MPVNHHVGTWSATARDKGHMRSLWPLHQQKLHHQMRGKGKDKATKSGKDGHANRTHELAYSSTSCRLAAGPCVVVSRGGHIGFSGLWSVITPCDAAKMIKLPPHHISSSECARHICQAGIFTHGPPDRFVIPRTMIDLIHLKTLNKTNSL